MSSYPQAFPIAVHIKKTSFYLPEMPGVQDVDCPGISTFT